MVAWGILGTARTNRRILKAVAASSLAEVVAVASRDRARAEAYAAERDIPRAYGSYEELLVDPEIDVVYVSLPNALHLEWSVRALEAGKHVLCEKPLSADPAAVGAAFDVAARMDRVLAEGMMYRHHPQTHRLRELDHYLDLLARKPGALARSLALRQERDRGGCPPASTSCGRRSASAQVARRPRGRWSTF